MSQILLEKISDQMKGKNGLKFGMKHENKVGAGQHSPGGLLFSFVPLTVSLREFLT